MTAPRLSASVGLVAVALLAACSGAHARPDDALAKTGEVYPRIDERLAAVESMRIAARADYYDEKEGQRVAGRDVKIVAKSPDMLRITLESGFNSVLASLASDGTDFTMLDMVNSTFLYGPATPENLSALLPIYLSGADFFRVLAGGFPVDDLAEGWRTDAPLAWNSDTGHYRLELPRRDGGVEIVELTHPDLAVARLQIDAADGTGLYRYEAKDFDTVDGLPHPGKSRFTFLEHEQDVTLFVDTWEHDVEPNDRIFTIREPRGVDVIYLGDAPPAM